MLSFNDCSEKFNAHIETLNLPFRPNGLYAPVRYILELGGKRLRPSICMLSAQLFSEEDTDIMAAATAIEVFHNFTLIHDDIMDNADVRRGKTTVHKKWNNNTAILSGDAAMIIAYDQLNYIPERYRIPAFKIFNQTAIEVCEGQQFDMDFEETDDVSLEEYMEMIRLKTAVLLAASMQLGALLSGASEADQQAIYEVGENLGLAFQLQDDYLDVFSNTEKFGKATGGDILNNKKTYLLIKALNGDDPSLVAELKNWLSKTDYNPDEKIAAVKEIYDKLGVTEDVQLAAIGCINNAIEILNQIETPSERKKPLEELIFQMMYREK